MKKKVVIMESPTKSKAVQNYLGKEYLVLSSDGHIRDMATKGEFGLGIDFSTFTPLYKTPRKKMPKIKELKKAVTNAKHVYLATDPDREGEAIAFHLDNVLSTGNISSRIRFNEITKESIQEAIANEESINMNLVHSQQARQMVDRMIGFRLSNLLQKKISSRSAGRVQSVALKLIADREKEISAFIPEEFWTISALYQDKYSLKLEKYKDETIKINNEIEANAIKNELSKQYQVININKQSRKRNSNNPLTTSTMLQSSATQLNFSASKTTFIAQQLYEGIEVDGDLKGFISYPRTDSTRINEKFVHEAENLIISEYGSEFYSGPKPIKSKKNVQDAHEAIRPTDLNMSPINAKKFLNRDQLKLYQLIYNRTLASLMSPADIFTTTIWFNNNNYHFKLTGQEIKFQGFLVLDPTNNDELNSQLPTFQELQIITCEQLDLIQNFTKPRSRYSEARLIKELEEEGIGRPSTYSPILNTIQIRGYVTIENKAFKATEKGLLTNSKLQEFFYDIINEKYTSEIEEQLDVIAQGVLDMTNVVKDFWEKFEPRVENALANMKEEKIAPKFLDEICPKCQEHQLVERTGRYGKFIACSGFPKCRFIKKELKIIKKCPACETGNLVIKSAKGKKQFLGCTNYPECKHIEKYDAKDNN